MALMVSYVSFLLSPIKHTRFNLRIHLTMIWNRGSRGTLHCGGTPNRVRSTFFDQVGHETVYASSGNNHFSLNHVIVRLAKIMNNLFENLKIVLSKSFFCVENLLNLSEKNSMKNILLGDLFLLKPVFEIFDI